MHIQPLPQSKQEAFFDSPLYSVFSLEGREEEELTKFFYGSGTLDSWCPKCERHSVFRIASKLAGYGDPEKKLQHSGLIDISASCIRGQEGDFTGCRSPLSIVLYKEYNEVRKIGQDPSAADLAFGALDEAFEKELDPDSRRELGTAIGLHAHGVGIGSFVYLRRIFETLLEDAHQLAQLDENWEETSYRKARISERIGLLREHLPQRLVASANLYSLLSVGIHELDERTCLDSFELVKGAIELILKGRLEERRFEATISAMGKNKSRHNAKTEAEGDE